MSLEFFNSLSAVLEIELAEPAEDVAEGFANQKVTSTAEIVKLTLLARVREGGTRFRDLTVDELHRPVLMESEVTLRGLGAPVTHRASNGRWFAVGELLAAMEETERLTRPKERWFGGIDVHHRYFEGIEFGADGVWEISWGS